MDHLDSKYYVEVKIALSVVIESASGYRDSKAPSAKLPPGNSPVAPGQTPALLCCVQQPCD